MELAASQVTDDGTANGVALGQNNSELQLVGPSAIRVMCNVAALLPKQPSGEGNNHYSQKPYWHIERARIDASRNVAVELIVNGLPVERQEIAADGTQTKLKFETEIQHSSWVAVRILGSSHTNPVFVIVNNQPIRASRKSAQWCLDGVNRCWSQKERFLRAAETADAKAAYEHARNAYQKILEESVVD